MTRRHTLLAGTTALFLLALAVLVRVGWSPLADADRGADDDAYRLIGGHPTALAWVRAATHLGDPLVVTAVVAVALVACWLLHRRAAALYLLVVRAVSVALGAAIKLGVARARPHLASPLAHAHGYSFPSGHALGAAATYLSLTLVATYRQQGAVRIAAASAGVVAAISVAATRVLLGVHFPSDVVAGLMLGWSIALLSFRTKWLCPPSPDPPA